MPTFNAKQLQILTASIFHSLGAPRADAELVAKLLVEANLTGFDSHGVIRLPIYARGIKQGAVKPGAEITLVKESYPRWRLEFRSSSRSTSNELVH
jgi:uncharacterized oxidoreductase